MSYREYRLSIARLSRSPKAAAFIARLEAMTDEQYEAEQERYEVHTLGENAFRHLPTSYGRR